MQIGSRETKKKVKRDPSSDTMYEGSADEQSSPSLTRKKELIESKKPRFPRYYEFSFDVKGREANFEIEVNNEQDEETPVVLFCFPKKSNPKEENFGDYSYAYRYENGVFQEILRIQDNEITDKKVGSVDNLLWVNKDLPKGVPRTVFILVNY